MRKLAIFGSTGSVGQNALKVVENLPGTFEVVALAAARSADELATQVHRWKPKVAVVADSSRVTALRDRLNGTFSGEMLGGTDALVAAASRPDVEIVLNAITGAAGLPVSLAAVRTGKRLALANKESLVTAGPLLMAEARKNGAEILPVDSEHSAIFQALQSGRPSEVAKLILTASGGPFRTRPANTFASVTREEALTHPTWKMGPKITVDSATLMNKALEVVEARWLFDATAGQLDVVVHPQSIVHSMVLFRDGSVIAQMGRPDMCTPIQYALTYPDRLPGDLTTYSVPRFNGLTFEEPDHARFPSLGFGFRAAREGGLMGTVMNAANERAVELFLAGEINFPAIFQRVGHAMDRFRDPGTVTLETITAADRWARDEVGAC